MHRLLARSGADPELRAKAEYKQRQNNAQYLPTKYSLGYPGKTTKLKTFGGKFKQPILLIFARKAIIRILMRFFSVLKIFNYEKNSIFSEN